MSFCLLKLSCRALCGELKSLSKCPVEPVNLETIRCLQISTLPAGGYRPQTQHTLIFNQTVHKHFNEQQKRSPLHDVVACKLCGIRILVRDFFICDHVWSCGVSGFLIDCKHLSGNCLFYKHVEALSLSFNKNLV